MERDARAWALAALALALGAAIGWGVGVANRDPDPRAGPTASFLGAWAFATFAAPLLALAAARLAPARAPAAALAFWSTGAFGLGTGLAAPAAAFAPADFGLFGPIDWVVTIGRGIGGLGGLAALAAALAWAIAREPDAPAPEPAPEPPRGETPTPIAPRDADPEALAIAKRRLAMGEITRHDYDELVRRLRE